jgi:hypothetical protein
MVYEKNRLNETGIWVIVLSAVVVGPVLFVTEQDMIGKFVGIILTFGGVFLVYIVLFQSVRKITTYEDRMELDYYLVRKTLPYSSIAAVKLRQQHFSSNGIRRTVDVLDVYLYPDKKLQIGGNFGGFFKHSTKRLYEELCAKANIAK